MKTTAPKIKINVCPYCKEENPTAYSCCGNCGWAFYYDETEQVYKASPALPPANELQFGGSHYKDMGVEPWDVVDTWPIEQQIGYYRGGALKYIMRMGAKDVSVQELRKAGHYIQKLIERLEQHS